MTGSSPNPKVADVVAKPDRITEYDDRHHETYIRLLDADADGASKDDMARLIFGIDPAREPDRAHRAVESHLDRARWMTRRGYRVLVRRG